MVLCFSARLLPGVSSPPGAPRLAVTFLLAQESNQRMPFKYNAHLGLVRHLITQFRPAVGRLEMAALESALWQALPSRSGTQPALAGTSASRVARSSWIVAGCLAPISNSEINEQRRTDPRSLCSVKLNRAARARLRVLKRWLSAGPRRHGLPERTLKRCHFGAANGSSKPCDESADQALMCVVFKRHSLVTFLGQQESDRLPGRDPGGLPTQCHKPRKEEGALKWTTNRLSPTRSPP